MSSVTIETIAPSRAVELLKGYTYKKQRPISPEWVRYLAEEMGCSSFKQDTQIEIAKHKATGKETLIDGYHRLSAVVESSKAQRFTILVTDYDSPEEVDRIYYRIDMGKRRGTAEQMRALEIDVEYGLNLTQVRRLAAAVAFINSGWFDSKYLHPDERERLVREYAEACGMYFACVKGRHQDLKTSMERASTLSVGLVTLKYSAAKLKPGIVEEFWQGVALDDGLSATDPRKMVHHHLLTTGIRPTGMSEERSVSPALSARVIALGFNMFVSGAKLKGKSEPRVKLTPMDIKGSPFNGK